MKRWVLAVVVLVAACKKDSYPTSLVEKWVAGCVQVTNDGYAELGARVTGDTEAYCTCIINKYQEKMPYKEFQLQNAKHMADDPKDTLVLNKEILAECRPLRPEIAIRK
jgi:hypothetical protein